MDMGRRARVTLALLLYALVAWGEGASAEPYTVCATTIPCVSDWENEPWALGGPSYCDETGCCAGNAYVSSVWLTATEFSYIPILSNETIVSVKVAAFTRYDRNTVNCNVRLPVSGPVPEQMSDYYVWDQGNSGECRWVVCMYAATGARAQVSDRRVVSRSSSPAPRHRLARTL